jgi:hypothetical protein
MIDWNSVENSLMQGFAWGFGFTVCFAIGLTYAWIAMMNHPTVKRIAGFLSKGKDGDWLSTLITEGARLFKPPEQK